MPEMEMVVTCAKIGYSDKGVALKELTRMQRTIRNGPLPIRVYWCSAHKAWHITSKPKRKGMNLPCPTLTTTFQTPLPEWLTA